ncbi:MAG: magnesium transporter [Bacteroidetes bacterium]|nr:magnesium transporter [Bacteroidota bacterium]
MDKVIQFEPTKEYLEKFREALENKDDSFIGESLDGVNSADITMLLEELNAEESKYVVDLLEKEVGSQIIKDLDSETRSKFLKIFQPVEIAGFVDLMDSDDAADIFNEMPAQIREEVIAALENEEKATYILDLLRYEDDVAGGLMAKELIRANENWTIKQCIEEIRRQRENVQKVYSVYVVDNKDRLKGRVSLKKLILTDDNGKVEDIYDEEIISVETYMPKEEVAAVIQKYDLETVPVVNVKGRLVGRITVDDIIDVITEQAEEERQLMAGISEDVEEDDSIWMLTRARLPWLVVGLAGGMIGAQFIQIFEEDLIKVTAIAFFIPLIMATGGNVGIQSSALIVQSLASPSAFMASTFNRLTKIFFVAIINGLFLSILVFLMIYLINDTDTELSFVVSIALFSVVFLASFLGTLIPILLHKMGINPALASGPFITTTIDLLGLAVYFLVAHLLYNP